MLARHQEWGPYSYVDGMPLRQTDPAGKAGLVPAYVAEHFILKAASAVNEGVSIAVEFGPPATAVGLAPETAGGSLLPALGLVAGGLEFAAFVQPKSAVQGEACKNSGGDDLPPQSPCAVDCTSNFLDEVSRGFVTFTDDECKSKRDLLEAQLNLDSLDDKTWECTYEWYGGWPLN